MEKTQYDVLLDEIRKIRESINDIDTEMAKDRDQLQNFNLRLSAVESQLEEQRKATNRMAERIRDKVQDVVDPIIESSDRLSAQIKRSKMTVLREDTRNWFQKFMGKEMIK